MVLLVIGSFCSYLLLNHFCTLDKLHVGQCLGVGRDILLRRIKKYLQMGVDEGLGI